MIMKKDLYLFRHGQTDFNAEGRFAGQKFDIPVNAKGIEQAEKLSLLLKPVALDIIYSSPLIRAKQTAEIVAKQFPNIQIIFDDNLKETNYGDTEGKLYDDLTPENLTLHKTATNPNFSHPNGETQIASADRFMKVLQHIVDTTDYKTIGISSHGGIIRYVLVNKLGFNPHDLLPHAIPFHVVYEDGKFSLVE
jgi:broad specificity phosphatase PhoE